MISDNDLYKIAIFLGTTSMILIIAYHYLEVNASPATNPTKKALEQSKS
jgi:hypothetical protein